MATLNRLEIRSFLERMIDLTDSEESLRADCRDFCVEYDLETLIMAIEEADGIGNDVLSDCIRQHARNKKISPYSYAYHIESRNFIYDMDTFNNFLKKKD